MRLHERVWGAEGAPAVICLHGVNAHGGRFHRLAERLAERFRIRALDLRGHGRSGWEAPWTLEAHVDDLRATVTEPSTWIGHSFGGRLVLELAAREPALVQRIVLLDPAIAVPRDIAHARAEDSLREHSFASPEEALAARVGETGLGSLAHTPREFLEEDVREHLAESPDGRFRYRYLSEAVAAAYHEMANDPPPFEALRIQTLLVVGSHSKLVSAGELERYRGALGDLLEVVVAPGGHIVLWDAFEECAAAIEDFLG